VCPDDGHEGQPVVAADALTALDERLEQALRASGVGVWEWDLSGDSVRVSDAVGPLYGLEPGGGPYSVREFLRNHCHPDDRPLLDEALHLLLTANMPADLRFRALQAGGGERLLGAHARLVRDADGGPLRLVGVIHDAGDVGDRRFRGLADSAPVLMWATGPDLACTFFNTAYLRFTGRALADELGEGWRDLVHPDDRESVRAADAQAEGGMAPFEARYRLRRHDGVYRWMQDSGVPVFGPDGRFEGLTGGMVDLHDLIEREVLLDGIFAGAPLGIALFGPDLRYRRVNEAYAAMTGIPAADHAIGASATSSLGIAAAATEMLQQVLRTGEPAHGVVITGTTGPGAGIQRRLVASYIPLVIPGGEVAGLAALVQDDTERHSAEQDNAQLVLELRAQSDLYETLLRAQSEAGEGFVLWSGDQVAYANEAAQQLTGRTIDELRGLGSYIDLVPRERRDEVLAMIAAMVAGTDSRTTFETEIQRPDGEIAAVEIAARALRGRRGVQFVVLGRDVSERKAAERERERLLVAERAARREIEAAHARASFLAGVSAILERSPHLRDALREVADVAVRDVADVVAIDVIPRRGEVLERVAAAARDGATRREMLRTLGVVHRLDEDYATVAAAREGRSLWSRDAEAERVARPIGFGDMDERLTRAARIHSFGLMPLTARGSVVGVLSLGWQRARGGPGGAERELIDDFARRIALWIDNSQLYDERAQVASTLQTALLPPELPAVPGVELAARYLPADEASEVGGDFYDVFPADGGWAVVVGDVCGKGAKAAAVTALARYTLRAAFAGGIARPADGFALLDAALLSEGDPERFLTAALGVLRPAGDGPGVSLRMVRGGHPAPIVLRAGGGRETVEVDGRLIGVAIDGGWDEAEVVLRPGDALLLYTDGVTEADRRCSLDAAELAALLPADIEGLSCEQLAGALVDVARERGGERLRDDIAALALLIPR